MEAQIGLKPQMASQMTGLLNVLLADEFTLSLKTRNAHWNLEGHDFYQHHLFFEQQFKELDEIIDDLAEYIRSLGHYAPATMTAYLRLTHLDERPYESNNSNQFMQGLLADHEQVIVHLREIDHVATSISDSGSNEFITGILKTHMKMSWMLRAHLNNA